MKEEKKSSKEILSELFDKFNATPPSSPSVHEDESNREDDKQSKRKDEPKDKSRKREKKSKKEKVKDRKSSKKKKKRHRSRSSSGSSSEDSDSEIELRSPKKKRRSESDSDARRRKKSRDRYSSKHQVKKEKTDKRRDDKKARSDKRRDSKHDIKIKKEVLDDKDASKVEIKIEHKSDSTDTKEKSSVVLPDVIPTKCKSTEPCNIIEEEGKPLVEPSTLPQVADIFVEELLESAIDSKASSNEKPKLNIKIGDLKQSNILELAEQKLKEKADKYEEGEITSESSDNASDTGLPSLRPVDSDKEEKVTTIKSEEKVKKCTRHKSHKSSHKRRSRSRSRSKRRSHSKERRRVKRSRSRSKSKERRRRRSHSVDRKKEDKERHRDRKSHRDKDGHRRKDKEKVDKDRKDERKEEKLDKEKKESDRKHQEKKEEKEKKDKDKDKDKKKESSKERRSRSKDRRRNQSKSPIQLPSMVLQENPNRKKRRSRSRTRGLEIDKKKLLEIARKNALSMLKQQGLAVPAVSDPVKVATTITAGGKTVDELTDFCKQLSQKEGKDEHQDLSPISDSSEDEHDKAFHHPFLIKDRPNNIVMNIRNCTALPVKTHQEKTAENAQQLRLQFPVSSGTHHRRTESEWVPVEPKKDEASGSSSKSSKVVAKISTPTIPQEDEDSQLEAIEPPPLPPPQLISVFPSIEEPVNINIGDVVGQKLAATKRLQDNPMDFAAQNLLRDAEDKLARWNESNQLQQPGLFTGSTGARLLTPAELASGQQAWAKKDQLMCAQPVTEGIGKSLLQKMGWKPGEGLGKNHEGTLEPLSLPLKMDKRGLLCAEEVKRPPRFLGGPHQGPAGSGPGHHQRNIRRPTVKSLEGKHPVSLLLEYCSKRHFNPPIFSVIYESGPSHKRTFLFKVEVNGMEYQPPVPSHNKKQAKSEAAMVCLRALGLMPSTNSTP